jgi:hypothetical protein
MCETFLQAGYVCERWLQKMWHDAYKESLFQEEELRQVAHEAKQIHLPRHSTAHTAKTGSVSLSETMPLGGRETELTGSGGGTDASR